MAAGRSARLVGAVAIALIAAYAVVWAQVSTLNIGRSDFTSTYVGGTLIRDGQRAHLYDEAAQQKLHARLILPDTEGNLPFVDAPVAAALAAPVTSLDLRTAYRVWSVLQLAVLIVAIVIAVRSAPWPRDTPRSWKVAAGTAALAGAGSLVELMQAQWGSVTALGLALAYRDWRTGHHARGAALLVGASAVAKPHLAVGLVAFMIGWRQRRVIAGALAGAVAMGAASLAVAGPAGVGQFFSLALTSNTRWQLRTFAGFVGIPGSFLGNGGAAQVIGAAGSVAALVVAGYLGWLVKRQANRLDVALAGAAVLSLLAAPHAGTHDLVMLAPAVAWCVAVGARPVVLAGWGLLSAAAFISLGDGAATPPGQLVPWVLIAAAVLACRAARNTPVAADLPLTSGGDEAALGSLADGVHRRGGVARRVLPLQGRSG
jgi:Glycosyltransferase family 87